MGKWGNQARRKHQRQKQRRREKLERERDKTPTGIQHEHAYSDFEEHQLPNLQLLLGGILTFLFGAAASPMWWANHRWIGGVAFALSILFIALSVVVGEKDA